MSKSKKTTAKLSKGSIQGIQARSTTGPVDSLSISLELEMLLLEGKFAEAAMTIADLAPNSAWCDKAVSALLWVGNHKRADKFLTWARSQDDRLLEHTCAVAYAETEMMRDLNGTNLMNILPAEINQNARERIVRVDEILRPMLKYVESKKTPENNLEVRCVSLALRCAALLRRADQIIALILLLSSHKPIPLDVGQIVLQYGEKVDGDVPGRLRNEYSNGDSKWFRAQCLAAMLDTQVLGNHSSAFDNAQTLQLVAKTTEERHAVFQILSLSAQHLGDTALEVVTAAAKELLSDDVRLRRYHEIQTHLARGAIEHAHTALEEAKDETDHIWLQLKSSELLAQGDRIGAAELYWRAAQQFPHAFLLRRAANLAMQAHDFDTAIQALERLRTLEPSAAYVAHNLAFCFYRKSDYRSAAEIYRELQQIEPGNPDNALNCGICFSLAGDVESALRAFAILSTLPDRLAQGTIATADLLVKLGRVADAFDWLSEKWDTLNNDPIFVSLYMKVGYAAGRDDEGNKALQKLIVLQEQGFIPKDTLKSVSINELQETVSEWAKAKGKLNEHYLHGKIPWLAVDSWQNMSYYWAWRLRTQKLAWMLESSTNRAEYTIYATNGFEVRKRGKNRTTEDIHLPAVRGRVIFDLSTLVTLHEMGLITEVAACYKEVLLPSTYADLRLQEGERLQPHQLSRMEACNAIVEAISSGKIRAADYEADGREQKLPTVNEYVTAKEEGTLYRLVDLLPILNDRGRVPSVTLDALAKLAQHTSATVDGSEPLHPGDTIIIDEYTLYTLFDTHVFGAVIDLFDVRIAENDRKNINATHRAFHVQREVLDNHHRLWKTISGISNIRYEADLPASPPHKNESTMDLALAASTLARRLQVPLVCDDRCIQMTMLNVCAESNHKVIACDTSHLLLALHAKAKISLESIVEAYAKVIAWRYRFIVPPPIVLKAWADRYYSSVPGEHLRELALYVQDCMRDPGLFTGIEKTKPPSTMASKLIMAWGDLVGRFSVLAWLDPAYDDTRARALTDWAIAELLPTASRSLDRLGFVAGDIVRNMVMTGAFIEVTKSKDLDRSNKCLTAIKSSLTLDDDEYLRLVEGFANAI